ncbi:MAG: hydrolase [Porticoccaceae bacterium]|nr:MAG: hydrolase [Porticoccaceae bacterium]
MSEEIAPTSRRFRSGALELHYLDWGGPDTPPLILLHGIRDHAHSWDRIAPALAARFRVVAPDLRGHGDSDWSRDGAYLPIHFLEDLAALVEVLGGGPVDLVAHSFGGNPAVRYAALYPERVRRLVLADALGPSPRAERLWAEQGEIRRTREWLERRRAARARAERALPSLEEAAGRLRKGNPRLAEAWALHLARHGTRPSGEGWVWKHDPLVGIFAPEDFAVPLARFWQAITAPVLILTGSETWNANPAEDGSHRHFRAARCRTFPGAGHWLHHDQPKEFVAAVAEFLA